MKRVIILLLFSFLVCISTNAQDIRRWKSNSKEITSKQIPYTIHSNVFKDYGWTYPDIKSREILMGVDGYDLQYKGYHLKIKKTGNEEISIMEGTKVLKKALRHKSNKEIYYNKKLLKVKPHLVNRWVSKTEYRYTTVPVIRYRTVGSYQYDAMSKSQRYVSHQESYTAYESHTTPYFTSQWNPYTEYVIDIPAYDFYSIVMNDSTNLILYETEGHYYLQNISYLKAKDDKEVNYIITDSRINGSFTDGEDELLATSWNPYDKNSSHKNASFLRENKWMSLSYLSTQEFLTVTKNSSDLIIDNKNDEYINVKEHGRVHFANLPDKSKAIINGTEYSFGNRKKGYKSEYGTFNLKVTRLGYLDFDTTYTINDSSKEITIAYKETEKGATVIIKNLYSNNYYASVSNEAGYEKTYHLANKINIPTGKSKLEIYTDGNVIAFEIQANTGDSIDFNFEEELKKISTPATEEKDEHKEDKMEPEKK